MQIPVKIEKLKGRGFRAIAPEPFDVSTEGPTRAEVLESLEKRLNERASDESEIGFVNVQTSDNPWTRVHGMFADDPLFEKWQDAIQEGRDRADADEGLV